MVKYSQFTDIKYLASVFTPIYYFDANKILAESMREFRDQCDGEPLVIPLPEGAPQDLPRVILKSKNKIWQIEFSNIRINVRADLTQNENEEINNYTFIDFAYKVFSNYKSILEIPFGRIAVVVERQINIENSGLELAKHFCKGQWINTVLNRPEKFQLNAFKRYKINDRFPEVNSWIKSTGNVKKSYLELSRDIITVQQDLNTPQENTNESDYSLEEINEFLAIALKEMEIILKGYFPIED